MLSGALPRVIAQRGAHPVGGLARVCSALIQALQQRRVEAEREAVAKPRLLANELDPMIEGGGG